MQSSGSPRPKMGSVKFFADRQKWKVCSFITDGGSYSDFHDTGVQDQGS